MEGTIEVSTSDLLALIVIIDEFEEFNNNFIELINNTANLNFYKLKKIMNDEKVFGNKELKEFYINNKEIINVINSYSNIYDFVAYNYDFTNKKIKDSFYQLYIYLKNNKSKLNKVIDLVIKIKKLGFNYLSISTNYDFTEQIYGMFGMPMINDEISYLDNMYVIPSYNGDIINYKTSDSDYEIILKKGVKKDVYVEKMFINNLFMDIKKLPEEINYNNTFEYILKLRADIQNQYDILRQAINLSIGIDDLRNKYSHIFDLANLVDDTNIKNKLLSTLKNIEEDILELEYLSDNYRKVISNNNSLISENKVEEEKKLALKIRKNSYIDVD